MSDSIIERLRHHAQDERNTAFARSTMREAEQELAASREREARLIGYVEHLKVCAVCAESFLQDCEVGREIDAALAEGAQG